MKTYFVDKIGENAEKYPERIAAALDFCEEPLSYAELWERSGRIYAALKKMEIGREDIILLLLPRHPMIITALLGVLRAGAAVVLAEDSYPEERVEYIKKDCRVRLVIDRSFFEGAMECPALEGREPLRLHDAGFIFYTSGTTGNPKGILHEYGKLDIGLEGSIPDEEAVNLDECGRFAFVPPFTFSAVMIHALPELYKANTLYILSYDVSKNFFKLHELLEKERITELFLSPSVLRIYREGFPFVKAIMTGSEPASHLYVEGQKVIVHYAMTESLYCVSRYVLHEPCENAPIATRETGKNIRILGEDGLPVKEGETGEICFPDPYFRGYINMPEKTREVFHDGLFHSGDLGYRDEKGDIFIKGRTDDMIKINGNRIEPGEIEAAAREISGVKDVIAKGFCDNGRSYVALYYLAEEAGEACIFRDAALARKKLGEKLPPYMIPTYFVPIEALPLNANGKLSRRLLKAPEAIMAGEAGRKPVGETEKAFCEMMAKVLSVGSVGAEDDFFEAGGDSVSAIRLVTECAERGYDVTVAELQENRTAAKLARNVSEKAAITRDALLLREKEARKRPKELLSGQVLYWELFERYPKHPSLCVPVIAVLKKETDPVRLKSAVDRVIAQHPALLSHFRREEDGKVVQYYDESAFQPTLIEEMSEGELKEESKHFLKPVDLTADRMYTTRIICTPEKKLFLLSVHHIVGDGTSNGILLRQIAACYREPKAELPPDCYYSVCEEETGEKAAVLKKEAAEQNRKRLKLLRQENSAVLKPELPGPDQGSEAYFLPGVFPKSEKYRNRVFLTACLIAMAESNGCDSAMVYSAYNGRDRHLKEGSVGCHTVLIPVMLTDIRKKDREELLSEVQAQLDFGTVHSVYSALTESGLPPEQTVIFNYQHGTMDFGEFNELSEFISLLRRDKDQPNCLFNTGVLDREGSGRLDFYCNYPRGMYSQEGVARFGESFVKAVRFLSEEKETDSDDIDRR